MKKTNRFIQGTIIASVLFSCDTNELDETQKIYQEQMFSENVSGFSAISISYNLEEEDMEYIDFLAKLNQELFSDRMKAREFSVSPKEYLQKRGFDYDISMDDSMLKLFQAYGDDDVYDALKSNDMKLFLNLCRMKGYVDTENMTSKIFERIKKDVSVQIKPAVVDGIPLTFMFMVTVGIGIYATAITYYYFYHHTQTMTSTSGPPEVSPPPTPASIPIYPSVLLLDSMINEGENTYVLYDKFVESEIDEIVDIVKDFYPYEFENEESVRMLRKWLQEYISKM